MNDYKYIKITDPRPAARRILKKEVDAWIKESILPSLEIVMRKNDIDADGALMSAIASGQVRYSEGMFSGTYSAAISKELTELGAWFHASSGTWRIAREKLPHEIIGALTLSQDRSDQVFGDTLKIVALSQENAKTAPSGVNLRKQADDIVAVLDYSFADKSGEKIELPSRDKVVDEWVKELETLLREAVVDGLGVMLEKIAKLRTTGRFDRLDSTVKKNMENLRYKAAILIENQVNKFSMDVVQEKAAQLGSDSYKWMTCRDDKVRPMHKALDGKNFLWSDPPIVNEQGDHLNPGQDINCRCWAVPIIPSTYVR